MKTLVPYIWVAGAVQLVIAAANIVLPGKLRYRENIAKLSPIVRQVFVVHAVYIVLVLVFFGLLCLLFAGELAGGSALGRFLSGFLTVFWSLRVGIQLFYYDPQVKRDNLAGHLIFTAAFIYLAVVFAFGAIGGSGR
jgi:FtsH-binding integral membrane protein